jgi:heme o synthase
MESSAGVADRGRPVGGVGRQRSRNHAEPGRIEGAGVRGGPMAHARDYLALTKPRIISLLLWTTVTTMFVAEPSGLALATILWTCLGGYLAAGGAGAINHYIDRDIDARMGRTKGRPIVTGRIAPLHALAYGIALGAVAVGQLWLTVNALTAALALLGLLGYTLLYSAFLKRRTPQNIVIGGAAGAIPPLVGWAAASGSLTLDALFPFMIVFLWTPPHFWALALLISDDYERTGVPMMPVVRGEEHTRNRILLYSVILVGFTLVPVATGFFGGVYLVPALLLGAGFLIGAWHLLRDHSRRAALQLHLGSLAYLFLLFGAMAADRIISA